MKTIKFLLSLLSALAVALPLTGNTSYVETSQPNTTDSTQQSDAPLQSSDASPQSDPSTQPDVNSEGDAISDVASRSTQKENIKKAKKNKSKKNSKGKNKKSGKNKQTQQPVELTGKVKRVSDGDTIRVKVPEEEKEIKVRLYGVDTPEKSQDFGPAAAKFTKDTVLNKEVTLRIYDTDRYGRKVAVVMLPDKTSLNELLLKKGLAWAYTQYCKQSFCSEYKKSEEKAKKENLGLWAKGNPQAPWDFRREARQNQSNKKKPPYTIIKQNQKTKPARQIQPVEKNAPDAIVPSNNYLEPTLVPTY